MIIAPVLLVKAPVRRRTILLDPLLLGALSAEKDKDTGSHQIYVLGSFPWVFLASKSVNLA
jgi:hypothetical protein